MARGIGIGDGVVITAMARRRGHRGSRPRRHSGRSHWTHGQRSARPIKPDAEQFLGCPICGQDFDMRDLGQVSLLPGPPAAILWRYIGGLAHGKPPGPKHYHTHWDADVAPAGISD